MAKGFRTNMEYGFIGSTQTDRTEPERGARGTATEPATQRSAGRAHAQAAAASPEAAASMAGPLAQQPSVPGCMRRKCCSLGMTPMSISSRVASPLSVT